MLTQNIPQSLTPHEFSGQITSTKLILSKNSPMVAIRFRAEKRDNVICRGVKLPPLVGHLITVEKAYKLKIPISALDKTRISPETLLSDYGLYQDLGDEVKLLRAHITAKGISKEPCVYPNGLTFHQAIDVTQFWVTSITTSEDILLDIWRTDIEPEICF